MRDSKTSKHRSNAARANAERRHLVDGSAYTAFYAKHYNRGQRRYEREVLCRVDSEG